MAKPVLAIEGLSIALSRKGRAAQIFDAVSFDIAAGEIIAIVGESGSGKSTLGLALQGLLPRESRPQIAGSIRIAGVEIVGASQRVLRDARHSLVRAVPQDPMAALNPTMTLRRQMAEAGDGDVSIVDWLRRAGLSDPERIADSFPHRLSGGQRQRVLIAMAMMAGPRLLIADEVTTALDVTTQAQILGMLRDLARERQAAILLITHDLAVAATLADRILVLYAGRIAEIGRAGDIIHNPAHPYSAGLLATRFDLGSDRLRPLPTLPAERQPPASAENACIYAPRCPLAQADCTTSRPSLLATRLHEGKVACFHSEQTGAPARPAVAKPWPMPRVADDGIALRLAGVSKSFSTGPRTLWGGPRPREVLRSINLSIRLGECVALVGESGAGKSTLLRIAAGLATPDHGTVTRLDEARPQVIFQDPVSSLTPWLSIGEQIGERLRTLGIGAAERRRRIEATLALVGLDPALLVALPAELSVGQCQRAVVARAIIVPPSLLLCDEPISAMDVSLAATTLNLLGGLRRRLGMAMLFVTHDLAAARIIADRIAVLDHGELIEDADPDTLLAAPGAEYTRLLIAAVPRLTAGAAQ